MSDERLVQAAKMFRQVSPTGKCDLLLAFDVIAYFTDSVKKHWPGILNFYYKSLPHIRERLRYYAIDGRRRLKRIEDDSFELRPFWASADAGARGLYGLTLHGGDKPEDASDVKFDFYYNGAYPGYVRLVVPIHFAQRPGLVEDVLALVSEFDLFCGTAGYAVTMRPDFASERIGGAVYALS